MMTELEKFAHSFLANALTGALAKGIPGAISGALMPLDEDQTRGGVVAREGLESAAWGGLMGVLHPGGPGRVLRDAGVGAAALGVPLGIMGAAMEPAEGRTRLQNAALFGSIGADFGSGLGMGVGPSLAPEHGDYRDWFDSGSVPPPHDGGGGSGSGSRPGGGGPRRSGPRPGSRSGEARPPQGGSPVDPNHVEWLRGVKTKADAKAAYRAQAMKNHPDRGGDVRKMQDLNDTWDRVQKHWNFQKWASLLGRQAALDLFGYAL